MQKVDSILIVKLSSIGDVVHSLPLLELLKENFPRARIDWLVEEDASQILKGHSAIDHVIVSRRKSWLRRMLKGAECASPLREAIQFFRELRTYEYDLVIDLQGILKSGVWVGFSKGKRKIGMVGAREGGGLFLNERPVPVDYGQHAVDRYLKLAEYLGCDLISWKGDIPVFESDKILIKRLLSAAGFGKRPVIAINPMARWKTKLWEPERFAALADRLRDDLSCQIIFTGSMHDRAIIKNISGMMKNKPINLAGQTTLKELAYLYTKCKALVATDTGPMHIAAAMGCQVVALFGPTDFRRTGPYGKGHEAISMDVECSPCFKKKCEHMTCMKSITVDRCFETVKGMLV